jgi:ABC-2 type transport system ATP-binding protein
MIEVENLTKRYATATAVEDVTFSVREGEIVGFLGPNGAGKTTTMRVLTGFLPPTHGTARIAGNDIVTRSREARAAIGYLPESAALYPEMRVREFLTYRARLEGVVRGEVRRRVDEAVERCLLSEVAGRKVENLSRGYRQRAALASALVHQPPVLILDEPTVGLDPVLRTDLWTTFASLAEAGKTLMISSHVMDEAANCDQLALMREGRLLVVAPPEEILKRTGPSDLTEAFLRLVKGEGEGGA